jgi:thioredoxin 1
MGFASGSKLVEITSTTQWDELIKNSGTSGTPVIVDFTAVWCPPCKMIAPVLEELAKKHTDLNFVKIDIDQPALHAIVSEFSVAAVPTFVSLKGDRRIATFSGADKNQLQRMVEDLSDL